MTCLLVAKGHDLYNLKGQVTWNVCIDSIMIKYAISF